MDGLFSHAGVPGSDSAPDGEAQLYVTPAEVLARRGLTVTRAEIEYAMSLLHAHTNRRTFWPSEYQDRLDVPSDRNQVRLPVTPVLQILSAAGRYSYGRRDRRTMNQVSYDYIAALAVFGSPPRFTPIDVKQIDVYGPTGECFLPTGFFLINYAEVELRWQAGYVDIPNRLKDGLLTIMANVCAKGISDRIMTRTGRTSKMFATNSYITPDVELLLAPYLQRVFI